MASISVPSGVDAEYQITLRDSSSNAVTVYDEADTLSAEVWSGDDQAILFSPTVTWLTPTAGTLKLTIGAAQTAAILPANYRIRVLIDTSDDRRLAAWEGWLEVQSSAGSATTPSAYCTFNDLLILAPWLATEQTIQDQAGFAEQRHASREWIDGIIIRSWRGQASYLQGLLDADAMLVTAQVRAIAAKRAIGLICQHILSGNHFESGYQALAWRFLSEASSEIMSLTAEIDTDADGASDMFITVGFNSIRRVG